MLSKACLLFFMVISVLFLKAQDKDDLEIRCWELEQFDIIEQEISINNNRSSINQIGYNQSMIVVQEHEKQFSNSVISAQFDSGNSGYIEQIGSGHYTILVQNGRGNEANAWSNGDLALTKIYQKGVSNKIDSYIDNQGILPKANILVQNGVGNEMQIALLGNGNCWYQRLPKVVDARQYGENNNLQLILDHSILPGIKVTQTGGQSVSITQTAFNFPMKKY